MSQIRRFREIVGPNGEITYEFASDSGESESSADEDYIPPAAALARRNAIPNLDTATDWVENQDPGRFSEASNLSAASNSSPLSSRSDSPSIEEIPGTSSFSRPVLRIPDVGEDVDPHSEALLESVENEEFNLSENDSSGDEFAPTPRQPAVAGRTRSRRGVPRRTGRRSRKGAARKKIKRPPVPPKPLGPLTVRRELVCHGNVTETKKNFRFHKVRIPKTDISVEDEQGYKIGQIDLFIEEGLSLIGNDGLQVRSFDSNSLPQVYPDMTTLEFTVHNDIKVMLVRQEKSVPDDQATSIIPPNGPKYQNRKLNYINVEFYYYSFEVRGDLPVELFDGLRNKSLRLEFVSFSADTLCVSINIMLLKSAILGDHDLQSIPASLRRPAKNVLSFLFGIESIEKIEPQEKEDIEWFYGQVQKYHSSENLPKPLFSLQHPNMRPVLRDYQKQAVHWMLFKEGVFSERGVNGNPRSKLAEITSSLLNKMSAPVEMNDISAEGETRKKVAFYNPFVGYVSWSRPEIPPIPTGGILADEMGLGKTVEMLALILLHPCRDIVKVETSNTEFTHTSSLAAMSSESDSESESSDDEAITSRKRKKVRAKQAKVPKLPKRRKRSPSPSVFEVHNFDEDFCDSSALERRKLPERKAKKRLVISDSSEEDDEQNFVNSDFPKPESVSDDTVKGLAPKYNPDVPSSSCQPRKVRKSSTNGPVKQLKSNYDRVKVLYDAALSEYSAAKVVRPKFHGTFFETTIQRKKIFECLCGEGIYSNRRKVLRCTNCLSSQHADCVNFDRSRNFKTYLCPHCEVSAPPIPVKTTLIVTPATISHQWIGEISRHILNKHLKILFYKGVSKHGYFPPYKFSEYDLVITTYSVLSADLYYVDLPHTNSEDGRKFRKAKRFLSTPSSLTAVYWWRVCLDEAQMVEGMATKMALMASRLQGVHRWCVTGTPLNKGLEDLHGLIAFLGVSPISEDLWWEFLVRIPFHKKDTSLLFELFGQTIWRTGKQSVLAQLGIPKQTEVYHWLQFSPVEMHFYKRQYETCSSKIMAKISRLKQVHGENILQNRLSALDRQTLHSLLQPFLELRQACCHPQMVRGNVISLHKLKGTMTMEDLLDLLIKKTKIQCADDHRLIIAALNGLAGLFILCNRWGDAAEKYREVLRSAEDNKDKFPTDSLQLLHALENLADVLDGSHVDVGYTLNDEKLRSHAEEIRKKYLEKYAQAVKAAQDVVYPVTNSVIDLLENFKCNKESWWFSVLHRAVVTKKDEDLISRIKDDLTYKAKMYKKKTTSIANTFEDTSGLQYVMIQTIQKLEEQRDDVLGGLEELISRGPESFVEAAVFCHLRGQAQSYYKEKHSGFRCNLCEYHDRFLDYEALLFSTVENIKINRTGRNRQMNNFAGSSHELTGEERAMVLMREEEELIETTEHVNVNMLLDQRRQTWADSDVEKIIKTLLGFAKLNGCSVTVIDDGTNHVKAFETMKKEFRLLRILWRQVYDQVSAIDELSQATTRLRIVTENDEGEVQQRNPKKSTIKALSSGITEKADKILNIHVLHRHEVDLKIEQIQGDCEMGKDSLAIHVGQLVYLDSLNKNGYGKKGAFNSDDCPVCANPLGHQWCVLVCGHSFCTDCIKELGSRNPAQSFQCPLCRANMKMATVSFIDTRMDDENNRTSAGSSTSSSMLPATKPVEVKGSHSTKVESVVGTLLRLQESHPGEKCLIFSQWTDVLEIIAHALEQNDIKHCILMNSSKFKFHTVIERFKNREDIQALLIPLQSGSKGLNLIEATHVLLVEPIFNLASELQAVGRVHRIGQTKPTFVHRFCVRSTIEEQLFEILKDHDVSSDEEGLLTIADLQQLITKGTLTNVQAPIDTVQL
ncbi:unnamed protein product [Allacma fusca]|uniref:E3 ubiquitin-protein ligase SHPRH n=1 Tax=Allacma fusca TaxID=39272 RepID=A0A8J2JBA7_9HEXA|nr:unnamed protein product [Allacma fusca]